jgi:regulator of protease activity HflC (stomatin/prohibitin superfamily)
MKRVRINTGKIGLVFRNSNYKRVIAEGVHWLLPNENVLVYDMTKPFHATIELNILLQDIALAEHLTVVDVKDQEIVLQYENGNFKTVLTAGRYTYWKGLTDFSFVRIDLSKIEITENIDILILLRKEVMPYIRVFTVESYEKGILLIDGKFVKILETGVYYFWKNPTVISVLKADLRQLQLEISGQEILTKDSIG